MLLGRKDQQLCVIVKRRGWIKITGPVVHDDQVPWRFTIATLDKASFAGITEDPTGEDKPYVCAIKDSCSKRIVGPSMGP